MPNLLHKGEEGVHDTCSKDNQVGIKRLNDGGVIECQGQGGGESKFSGGKQPHLGKKDKKGLREEKGVGWWEKGNKGGKGDN